MVEIRVLYCEKEENGKEKALAKIGDGGEIVRTRNRTEKSFIVAGEEFIPAIAFSLTFKSNVTVETREMKR